PIWIQVLVFTILSVVMLSLSKTIFQKYIRKKPIVKTNTDALLGKNAVVIEDINNLHGQGAVKINSQTWSARSEDPSITIKKGSIVEITKVEGVKLICNKID
ncbi:MAG: NfeD family protein, partial [Clostridia bacterium]|nr:NfeD family protein [Clostridia bacterium]